MKITALALSALAASVSSEVYFKDDFNDAGWEDRWVKSVWKPQNEIGEWKHTPGEWYDNIDDKGIKTGQDARFYGLSSKLSKPFNNLNKDLVLQFLVKHEQRIDCGGAYLKLLPSSLDPTKFGGDSDYSIMFGPDICGSTRKTHVILNYARPTGEKVSKNLETKSEIKCETDIHPHLYTLVLKKDNTYDVKIDGESVKSGNLAEDWEFQPPKQIDDPNETKPDDWVDEPKIADPEDKKPEGYDDIPERIPDPEAKKPDDWDDEDDGEWEIPTIKNPEYKGEWKPKMIDNPEYKGEWKPTLIDNPDYFEDNELHARCKDCNYVGFELWQVKSGTLFDDILVTDDIEEAEKEAVAVLEKIKSIKKVKEQMEEDERKKQESEKENKDENKDKVDEEDEDSEEATEKATEKDEL